MQKFIKMCFGRYPLGYIIYIHWLYEMYVLSFGEHLLKDHVLVQLNFHYYKIDDASKLVL